MAHSLTNVIRGKHPGLLNLGSILSGLSLEKVLDELHFWGLARRKKVIGKS
jgi:hypothetical protein